MATFHIVLCVIYTSISISAIIIIYQLVYHLFSCFHFGSNKILAVESSQTNTGPHKESSFSSMPPSPKSPKSPSTLKNKKHKQSTTKISKFFKYWTVICVILFAIVCSIVSAYPFIALLRPMFDKNIVAFYIMIATSFEIWFVAHMVLSLIFIGRLYFTFKSSAYAFSKRAIIFLIFCWCAMPFFAILSIVSYFIVGLTYTIIFGALFVFIDILLSFILLYLYLKKLFQLICAADTKFLLPVMTKYTLIYTVSFVATLIVFILLILTPMISYSVRTNLEIVWIFELIDCLTNICCLWLKFHFAEKYYNICCKLLDNKCQMFCKYCAKKKTEAFHNEQNIIVEIQKSSALSKEDAVVT